ncbi:MAG: hypothetical protein LBG31_05395 [Prevotellaceae bacterium]|jgi:hypothetical protein|nr:hypothetical protein [Prevotellaceae bacterium]
MKKILFLFALLASITASATVTVTPLSVDYSTQKVTFSVSWTGTAANDRVWIWIDFCPVTGTTPGTFAKAVISEAAADDGSMDAASLNGRGFYVTTNPSTVTATLDNAPADKFNWCVYGSDRPPYAEGTSGGYILHGSPDFIIQTDPLNTSSTVSRTATTYDKCIYGLTDATGYPGDVLLPAITDFTASSVTICAGQSVTLTATATNAERYSFDDGATWGSSPSTVVKPSSSTTYILKASRTTGACTVTFPTAITVTVVSANDITGLIVAAPSYCTNQYACTLTFSGWTATAGWEIEYGYGNTAGNNILGSTTEGNITCMSPSTKTSANYTASEYFWARTKSNVCSTTGAARTATYVACMCVSTSTSCCTACNTLSPTSYYYGTLAGACGCTQTNGNSSNITGCKVETVTVNGTQWQHCVHNNNRYTWVKQGNICR